MTKPFIDYFDVLGVGFDADDREIDRAYRRKVKEVHPDRHENDAVCVEKTMLLNEARDTLKDAAERKSYQARWLLHCLTRQHLPSATSRPRASNPPRAPAHRPPHVETKPTIWTPPPSIPSGMASTGSTGVGLGAALGLLGLLLGGAYLAGKANTYDRNVERYRGHDGKFRSGRFS